MHRARQAVIMVVALLSVGSVAIVNFDLDVPPRLPPGVTFEPASPLVLASGSTGTPVPLLPSNEPTASWSPTPDVPQSTPTPSPPPGSPPTETPPPRPAVPVFEDATEAAFAPVRIQIPKLSVDAKVVPVGRAETGVMEAPRDFWEVGWYRLGAVPGQAGKAVLAGHVDTPSGPAVFYGLERLQAGDEIIVQTGNDGQSRTFVVQAAELFWANEAPTERIFGSSEQSELVLITCGGAYDRGAGVYLQRWVVFAVLAQPATP
jgi:sortase (surface protein transpeptidase)